MDVLPPFAPPVPLPRHISRIPASLHTMTLSQQSSFSRKVDPQISLIAVNTTNQPVDPVSSIVAIPVTRPEQLRYVFVMVSHCHVSDLCIIVLVPDVSWAPSLGTIKPAKKGN
jgi:hypothetical protein